MDNFLKLSKEEREELVRETANRLSLHTTSVEKDFWVCLLLRELFAVSEIGPQLLFKGGTSLSKAYHVISRFSEDIDLSVDRTALAFEEGADLEKLTTGQRDNRIKKLNRSTRQWVEERLVSELNERLQYLLPSGDWKLESGEKKRDRVHVYFHYPRFMPSDGELAHVRPYVLMEFSARSEHEPVEDKQIQTYIAEQFPNQVPNAEIPVKVLAAVRTFWEKVTILHAESTRAKDEPLPPRLARHASDIWQLMQSGIGETAMQQRDMLRRVCDHKSMYYHQGRVDYSKVYTGKLTLVPSHDRLTELDKDYRAMREYFPQEPPYFEQIVQVLRQIQERVNA